MYHTGRPDHVEGRGPALMVMASSVRDSISRIIPATFCTDLRRKRYERDDETKTTWPIPLEGDAQS